MWLYISVTDQHIDWSPTCSEDREHLSVGWPDEAPVSTPSSLTCDFMSLLQINTLTEALHAVKAENTRLLGRQMKHQLAHLPPLHVPKKSTGLAAAPTGLGTAPGAEQTDMKKLGKDTSSLLSVSTRHKRLVCYISIGSSPRLMIRFCSSSLISEYVSYDLSRTSSCPWVNRNITDMQ